MSFYGCKRLKTANIPYHIENIKDIAFEEKTQIIRTKYKVATVFSEANDWVIEGGVLERYYGKAENIVVPAGVKAIKEFAFDNDKIKKVVLPQGLEKIGDFAFTHCKNLVEVKLQEGVKSLGEGVFSECSALKSVNLPESIVYVGGNLFKGCQNLTVFVAKRARTNEWTDGWDVYEDGAVPLRVNKVKAD